VVAQLVGQVIRLCWNMAEDRNDMVSERERLLREGRDPYGFDNIIRQSELMKRVFEQIRAAAERTTTVLIRGESGTGKELVANSIHQNSERADKPFVRLNCAALSGQLLESELFGYENGAYNGAAEHRPGRFEQADDGTLFLDEIGEVSGSFQAKLLRVLRDGEYEPVGGSRTRTIDLRIIAATNRNLEEDVRAGKFREDLYQQLNVMPIYLPPLRARLEDLPDLAHCLAGRIGARQGRTLRVTDCALRFLIQYDWPGNARELTSVLERAAIMADGGMIDRHALLLAQLDERILARGGYLVQPRASFGHSEPEERGCDRDHRASAGTYVRTEGPV
jgi:Nif-specific regulatory protein